MLSKEVVKVFGRGDRRDRLTLQVERNRGGEHGDASLRSLRFKPITSINGWIGNLKQREERTFPVYSPSPMGFTTITPTRPPRKNRLSALSTRGSITARGLYRVSRLSFFLYFWSVCACTDCGTVPRISRLCTNREWVISLGLADPSSPTCPPRRSVTPPLSVAYC